MYLEGESMGNLRQIIANTLVILTQVAQQGETITYGELLRQLGINLGRRRAGQVAAPYLDRVTVFCIALGLPPLSVLVVNGPRSQNAGQPGPGFFTWFFDADAARELVARHDWQTFPPPPFPIQA